MNSIEIIANIFGIIAWLLLIISYYKKSTKGMILIQIISSIFYALSYFLLGATSAFLICSFELIKAYLLYRFDIDDYVSYFSLPIYLIIAIYSYDGYMALLPVAASIVDTFTIFRNRKIAVSGGILSNTLWVIYDIKLLAYACAISDGAIVISNLIILLGLFVYYFKTDKLRFIRSKNMTDMKFLKILEIDKDNYPSKNLWNIDYQMDVYFKNDESFIFVFDDEKMVGYINYICINETLYNSVVNKYRDSIKIELDDICKFNKDKSNYLLIDSISVDPNYHNSKLIKKIKKSIYNLINYKFKKGYKIDGIISYSLNDFEDECFEELKFDLINKNDINIYNLSKEKIVKILNKNIK